MSEDFGGFTRGMIWLIVAVIAVSWVLNSLNEVWIQVRYDPYRTDYLRDEE